MKLKTSLTLLLLSLWVAACNAPTPTAVAIAGGPQAWIDAPLDGAALPVAPYAVVSHATDPKGIASFELSVNGQVVRTDQVDSAQQGQSLAHITQTWNPPAPGTYLLEVRAADPSGAFGLPAQVRVTVGGETATATATETATPEPSPTPTPTRRRVTSPPPTATPTPVPPTLPSNTPVPTSTTVADTTVPTVRTTVSTKLFYEGGDTCGPQSVTITANVVDPSGVADVTLFYRVLPPGSISSSLPWQHGAMTSVGGGKYQLSLSSDTLPPPPLDGQTETLQFYVVAHDGLGNMTQTQADNSVKLKYCPPA